MGVQGRSMGVGGPSVGFQGPSVGFQGPSIGFGGQTVGFRGPSVGFRGPSVGFRGPSVGVGGQTMGFQGPSARFGVQSMGLGGRSTGCGGRCAGLTRPRTAPSASASRSEAPMVAVGFSPRWRTGRPASRSDACSRSHQDPIRRCSATRSRGRGVRGLKPTATVDPSLRDGCSRRTSAFDAGPGARLCRRPTAAAWDRTRAREHGPGAPVSGLPPGGTFRD